MGFVTLGKTGIQAQKQAFGCLPIQRISKEEAVALLRRAYDGGMNYFDTARAYSDSEEKVGAAFAGMRDKVIIATKTGATTAEGMWKDLEESLRMLQTDYIDVYQFHNPAFCPKPGGEDGLYDAALEAKKQGKIRHIATACPWLTRPLIPAFTRPSSSPTATWPVPRSRSWWTSARLPTWALLP